MNFPKISIVIPSFNQGQFLEETILSVINQQYPNLELFVVDGASTDNSVDVIKKYEHLLTWWVSEKDKGQSEAINKGFARATGEIVSWLCSDDLYTPGTLHKVAGYFSQQDSNVGLIYGGITTFKNGVDLKSNWGYKNPSIERSLSGMAFSQPAAFFLKKYLDKVGGRVNEELHYGMDFDLFSRLACVCDFVPVSDIFAKYRLHYQSKSVSQSDRFMGDWNRIFVNLCNNMGWSSLNDRLRSSGVVAEPAFNWHYKFSFTPEKKIVEKVDTEKLLFYHLCYVLKDLYWNAHRPEARHLLAWLKKNYSVTQLKNEEKIPPIMKKLALPDPVLLLLKKLNRIKRRIL
ncbi:MAG TPA: glycosyltransferase family 2 protein [Chitinophagaceae bacterium]|nr:glycosyltransferase family 2 protein [Chitinophagaceae bacterium]